MTNYLKKLAYVHNAMLKLAMEKEALGERLRARRQARIANGGWYLGKNMGLPPAAYNGPMSGSQVQPTRPATPAPVVAPAPVVTPAPAGVKPTNVAEPIKSPLKDVAKTTMQPAPSGTRKPEAKKRAPGKKVVGNNTNSAPVKPKVKKQRPEVKPGPALQNTPPSVPNNSTYDPYLNGALPYYIPEDASSELTNKDFDNGSYRPEDLSSALAQVKSLVPWLNYGGGSSSEPGAGLENAPWNQPHGAPLPSMSRIGAPDYVPEFEWSRVPWIGGSAPSEPELKPRPKERLPRLTDKDFDLDYEFSLRPEDFDDKSYQPPASPSFLNAVKEVAPWLNIGGRQQPMPSAGVDPVSIQDVISNVAKGNY